MRLGLAHVPSASRATSSWVTTGDMVAWARIDGQSSARPLLQSDGRRTRAPRPGSANGPREPCVTRVFLSYAAEDDDVAVLVRAQLKGMGVDLSWWEAKGEPN